MWSVRLLYECCRHDSVVKICEPTGLKSVADSSSVTVCRLIEFSGWPLDFECCLRIVLTENQRRREAREDGGHCVCSLPPRHTSWPLTVQRLEKCHTIGADLKGLRRRC